MPFLTMAMAFAGSLPQGNLRPASPFPSRTFAVPASPARWRRVIELAEGDDRGDTRRESESREDVQACRRAEPDERPAGPGLRVEPGDVEAPAQVALEELGSARPHAADRHHP